jgi:hypothetical protein
LVKKSDLENLTSLDQICESAKHLTEVYLKKRLEFEKESVERLFTERIAAHYQQIAHGACSLFDIGVEVATTEYLPRELLPIKDYKEFLAKTPSTSVMKKRWETIE